MGEFSFEVPEGLRGDSQSRSSKNPPSEDFEFSAKGQADVTTTLKRLSQVPDGRELLNEVFRDTGAEKIHILDGSKHDLSTGVITPKNTDPAIILNSEQNADDRYLGTDGKYHDVTKEQVLAHEACHLTDFVGKDEYAAVACENDVMDGFDGHVPRASYTQGDDRGTSKFERAGAPLDQHSSLTDTTPSGSLDQGGTKLSLEDIGFGSDKSVRFTGDTALLAEAQQAGLSIPPHIAAEAAGFSQAPPSAHVGLQMRI